MSKNSTNDGIANKNFYGKSSQTNLNIPEENDKIDQFKILKLITAISETILAFTMIWGMMVLSLAWLPLLILLVLHIIVLVKIWELSKPQPKIWAILWIITNILWWIPVFGMIMHIITAIVLWVEYSNLDNEGKERVPKLGE